MTPAPRFQANQHVLLRSTKDRGRVDGNPSLDGGEYWYDVRFEKRVEKVVEEDLEPLDDPQESLRAIASRGSWGRIEAFRTALAIERLSTANQSTVYTYRAQRIKFEPHQYKPLLKFLESPDRRLLIADEVGLGKTIEAGLILAEMEARKQLDRVLIVCPSRLLQKWREELSRKFDQDFAIWKGADLEKYLTSSSRPNRLRAIVSMQTIRNMNLREHLLSVVDSIDLLIVDEAHHARNPSTLTAQMLRDLCDHADAVVLLTATPLHNSTEDLFTLLQALRPAEFRQYNAFDDMLQRYKGVHEAALLVRSQQEADFDRARKILRNIIGGGQVPSEWHQWVQAILSQLDAPAPRDLRGWLELERWIQDLHPLSAVITRTRKRDVYEHAPVRDAKVYRCQWTEEEDDAYQQLVQGCRKLGWVDQPLSLGQIQRARQAASCLPAALKAAWEKVERDDDKAGELTDILPTELNGASQRERPPLPCPSMLKEVDSKFQKLLELLQFIQEEEPDAKVLIFTFFVGTSRYLTEGLKDNGITAVRIAGDVHSAPKNPERDERGKVMLDFERVSTIRVLVSTEVGSEGLDFQFCHYLVNYDLPWNPMVVEQRIGRIDRYGQKADKVNVLSLVVEGTVEDRILLRLYERIGIFKQSIGQLEAILGEEISELRKEYVDGRLTPEAAEQRVERAAKAVEAQRLHLEKLEKNAGELCGHEEYLKGQLERVKKLGRYVTEKSILAVINNYLWARHPSVDFWEEPTGIYNLYMSHELKHEITSVAREQDYWMFATDPEGKFSFCCDGERAYERQRGALINASHPLLKAAKKAVQEKLENTHAKAAQGMLKFEAKEEMDPLPGTYFLQVYRHTVEGLRSRQMLEPIAFSQERQMVLPVEEGERLLHLILEQAGEWRDLTPAPALPPEIWDAMRSEAEVRNNALLEAEKRESDRSYMRRKELLESEQKHDLFIKKLRLETANKNKRTRIISALEGQLRKAETKYNDQLKELKQRAKNIHCQLSADPIAVCVVMVQPSN